MTKNQENRLSMFLTVQQTVNFHSAVWEPFKIFKEQFNLFEVFTDKIMTARKIQEGKITGVTKDKAEAAKKAVEKGLSIAGKLISFASITGNNKLNDRVSYSHSNLMRSRDTDIINRLQIIYEAADKYISELADYEITQEDLDELNDLNSTYRDLVENPRRAITNRARATSEIKEFFAEADTIIKKRLDKLIDHFKTSNTVLWRQYKSARKIIDLGHRKRVNEVEQEQTTETQTV